VVQSAKACGVCGEEERCAYVCECVCLEGWCVYVYVYVHVYVHVCMCM
jgi:hypothetical protein